MADVGLFAVGDDALLIILRKVVAAGSPCLDDVLLVCKRFRNVLLAAATSATITCNNANLLQHCQALQSMTLAACSRFPWTADASEGVPHHLNHLTSITHINMRSASLSDVDLTALSCLPQLISLRASRGVSDSATSLPHLARLTFLQSLDVIGSPLSTQDRFELVTSLTALTKFECRPAVAYGPRYISERGFSCLASLTALRSLDLQGANAYGDGMNHLSALSSLESLDLSANGRMLDQDLRFLARLTRLHTLKFTATVEADVNKVLAHVAGLTRLTELSFDAYNLTDEGLAHLTRLTAITGLDLVDCDTISESGLWCLSSLSSLRAIHLSPMTQVPIASIMQRLTGLTSLHKLCMTGVDDETLADICTVSTLTCLELQGIWSPQGVAHLSKLRALVSLDAVAESETDGNLLLQHVSGLTALEELCAANGLWGVTDESLSHMAPLNKLRSLYLQQCDLLTDDGLAVLSGLSSLAHLKLADCPLISTLSLAPPSATCLQIIQLIECPSMTDDSLTFLSSLCALVSLGIGGFGQLTDAGLAHLEGLTTLTHLALIGCDLVTDHGLQQLSRLQALQEFDLRGCVSLKSHAIAALGCLHALTSLDLSYCSYIPEARLSELAQLPRLQCLALDGFPFSLSGLAYVAQITTLRVLELRDCPGVWENTVVHLTRLVLLEELHMRQGSVTPDLRAHLTVLKDLKITEDASLPTSPSSAGLSF